MSKIKVFAGAIGTELQRRGYKTALPLWSGTANLDGQDVVYQILTDYINAGADIILSNTFRTNIRPWNKVGRGKEAEIATRNAIKSAVKAKATKPGVTLLASITSVEDCYEPALAPSDAELEKEHASQVELLDQPGIDGILIETQNTIREAKIICKYASQTGLPIYVSFVTDQNGDVISGEKLELAVEEISKFNPSALAINCRPPEVLTVAAEKLAKIYPGTKGIWGNGNGQPANELGWEFFPRCGADHYLEYAKQWRNLGFTIIGGCCGTDPEYIKLLAETLHTN